MGRCSIIETKISYFSLGLITELLFFKILSCSLSSFSAAASSFPPPLSTAEKTKFLGEKTSKVQNLSLKIVQMNTYSLV